MQHIDILEKDLVLPIHAFNVYGVSYRDARSVSAAPRAQTGAQGLRRIRELRSASTVSTTTFGDAKTNPAELPELHGRAIDERTDIATL